MTRGPHSIDGEGWSPIGLAVVFAAHVLALTALLSYQPTRTLLTQATPVFVRMVEPPPHPIIEPPKPLPIEPPPPKPAPKPLPKKAIAPTPPPPVVPAPQQLAAPETTPAPPRIEAPAPPPEPPKPVEAPPPAPVVATPPPAPPAPPPPVPVVPPNFNANYLSNPPPAYPAASRRMGEEGKVMVRVFVSTDGLPQKLEMRDSSGFARLDEAAMETIRRWKFVPARQGDQPVAAWVVVPIVFKLNQ